MLCLSFHTKCGKYRVAPSVGRCYVYPCTPSVATSSQQLLTSISIWQGAYLYLYDASRFSSPFVFISIFSADCVTIDDTKHLVITHPVNHTFGLFSPPFSFVFNLPLLGYINIVQLLISIITICKSIWCILKEHQKYFDLQRTAVMSCMNSLQLEWQIIQSPFNLHSKPQAE